MKQMTTGQQAVQDDTMSRKDILSVIGFWAVTIGTIVVLGLLII